MLQQLVRDTGGSGWAIASMLFFIGVWCVIVLRVWKASPKEMTEHARLPLSDNVNGQSPAETDPRA